MHPMLSRQTDTHSIILGIVDKIETLILTPDELAQRTTIGDQFVIDILRRGKVLYAA